MQRSEQESAGARAAADKSDENMIIRTNRSLSQIGGVGGGDFPVHQVQDYFKMSS